MAKLDWHLRVGNHYFITINTTTNYMYDQHLKFRFRRNIVLDWFHNSVRLDLTQIAKRKMSLTYT